MEIVHFKAQHAAHFMYLPVTVAVAVSSLESLIHMSSSIIHSIALWAPRTVLPTQGLRLGQKVPVERSFMGLPVLVPPLCLFVSLLNV